MKFATKSRWHYPPHLRHVAALPWEIKTSSFRQILKKKQTNGILIASTFVIHPQILIFSVFKLANLSPYWLQIKFSMSLFFYLFTIYFGDQFVASEIRHRRRHCSVLTINMILSDEDKILIRKAGQSVVLINCSKSCGTQAQITGGQAVADCAVPALKKTLSFFSEVPAVCHWLCSADCQVKWPRTPLCP